MTGLIVLTGPPGSGKSTVAELLLPRLAPPTALVRGDDFFAFLRAGAIDPWLPASAEQNDAVIEAAAAAAGRLARFATVLYEGVVGPWSVEAFRRASGVDALHYAVLFPPLDVCKQRVRERTGHGFTDQDATTHMWHEFERSRPAGDRWYTASDADAAEVARQIADALAAGTLHRPAGD